MEDRDLNDPELIDRVRAGDAAATERFGELCFEFCYGVAQGLTRDHNARQDLAQETCCRVLRALPTYSAAQGTVTAWVSTILRRLCVDGIRRGRVRVALSLDEPQFGGTGRAFDAPAHEPSVEEQLAAAEQVFAVQYAIQSELAGLCEGDQALLRARYWGGQSAAQTAEALGLSVALVNSRLHRAKGRLRQALQTNWPELFADEGDRVA